VNPHRVGDSVSNLRGALSPLKGTEFSFSTLAVDLWKSFPILRARLSRSAAPGFAPPVLDVDEEDAAPARAALPAAVLPVPPRATMTAKCRVWAAQGTQRGHSCVNAFLTFEPESEVDELTSSVRTPYRRRRRSVHDLMLPWSCRPFKAATPRWSSTMEKVPGSTQRNTREP